MIVVCGIGVGAVWTRTLALSICCLFNRNRKRIVTMATVPTTSAATAPVDIPRRSGTRATCVSTTSRRAAGVSTTTRLLLLRSSSSYAISFLRLHSQSYYAKVRLPETVKCRSEHHTLRLQQFVFRNLSDNE